MIVLPAIGHPPCSLTSCLVYSVQCPNSKKRGSLKAEWHLENKQHIVDSNSWSKNKAAWENLLRFSVSIYDIWLQHIIWNNSYLISIFFLSGRNDGGFQPSGRSGSLLDLSLNWVTVLACQPENWFLLACEHKQPFRNVVQVFQPSRCHSNLHAVLQRFCQLQDIWIPAKATHFGSSIPPIRLSTVFSQGFLISSFYYWSIYWEFPTGFAGNCNTRELI